MGSAPTRWLPSSSGRSGLADVEYALEEMESLGSGARPGQPRKAGFPAARQPDLTPVPAAYAMPSREKARAL